METVNENKLTRQRRLQIWILENNFNVSDLAGVCGISRQALSQALYVLPSIRPDLHAHCIKAGIPAELLAPPTRPKADLLRENMELREQLALLQARLGQAAAEIPQAS